MMNSEWEIHTNPGPYKVTDAYDQEEKEDVEKGRYYLEKG